MKVPASHRVTDPHTSASQSRTDRPLQTVRDRVTAIGAPQPEKAAQAVGDFFGLPPLGTADLGNFAIALVVFLIAVLVTRLLSRRLEGWLERSVAPKISDAKNGPVLPSKEVAAGLGAVAALALLTIAAAAYRWPPYSALMFDLAIAVTAAVAAWRLALAFRMSRSGALAIAFACGFLVLTRRYEQLSFVQRSLDNFAVSFGGTRISLLNVLGAIFTGVLLYAWSAWPTMAQKPLFATY